jgi:hypothetical protein
MPTVITLKIPKLPPMKNALRGRHWSAGYSAKKEWSWLLMAAASPEDRGTLRAWADLGTCVTVQAAIETKNLYDDDNLSSVGNVVLDALKWCRFIADDDPEHVKFPKPSQTKSKKPSLTLQISRYV